MPTRRYKKTFKRKRRTYRRRPFNMRRPRGQIRSGYLRILRWSSKDATNNCHVLHQGSDAAPDLAGFVETFSMANCNGYLEQVNLFDNFRVMRVLYRFCLSRNPDWASTTANRGWSTRIFWSHDFNDTTGLTQAGLFQRSNLKEVYLNNDKLTTKWYSLKPAMLTQGYESAIANSYTPRWRQWLDTNDAPTPHHGIKYGFNNLYAGLNLRMEAKIIMECKGIS